MCRYALMLQLAHDAIARHYKVPTMLYASIDQVRGGTSSLPYNKSYKCSKCPLPLKSSNC